MLSERSWRWSNVPVPRIHLAALVAGLSLQYVVPWTVGGNRRLPFTVGAGLVAVGLALVTWSVRTVGSQDVSGPESLVTAGPYAHSRNPMYVGWMGLYSGVALLVSSAWLLLAIPLVIAGTHRQVRREERALEDQFGDEYRSYRQRVPRYV